ncbi:actin depolymerizing factor [Pterulicium gracile]|uniref:Cofilin n=1 Tax=Pterulicium gracile TaxID=1884261 RepID=A0A5C3QHY8_9AGAR|nr:actin depolymerizing factor [Pterula gracilis]
MSSGVTANQACLEAYQSLKLGKKYRYIIYNLSKDNKEIVVEQTAERSSGDAISQYEEFLTHLSEAECRWAVYDFEFEKEDGGKRSKIVFFSWSPDTAKIKQKMLFASSKSALKLGLVGVAVEIQGTDFSEISYESVLDKASKGA